MTDLNRIRVLSGLTESVESNSESMERFNTAMNAPDAKIKVERGEQMDPLSKAEYQIVVYSESTDPNNVYVAEVSRFRNVYMSN